MKKSTRKCICCKGKGYVLCKKPERYSLTEKNKSEILSLYRKGFGLREIARMVSNDQRIIHPYTVSYFLQKINEK